MRKRIAISDRALVESRDPRLLIETEMRKNGMNPRRPYGTWQDRVSFITFVGQDVDEPIVAEPRWLSGIGLFDDDQYAKAQKAIRDALPNLDWKKVQDAVDNRRSLRDVISPYDWRPWNLSEYDEAAGGKFSILDDVLRAYGYGREGGGEDYAASASVPCPMCDADVTIGEEHVCNG